MPKVVPYRAVAGRGASNGPRDRCALTTQHVCHACLEVHSERDGTGNSLCVQMVTSTGGLLLRHRARREVVWGRTIGVQAEAAVHRSGAVGIACSRTESGRCFAMKWYWRHRSCVRWRQWVARVCPGFMAEMSTLACPTPARYSFGVPVRGPRVPSHHGGGLVASAARYCHACTAVS